MLLKGDEELLNTVFAFSQRYFDTDVVDYGIAHRGTRTLVVVAVLGLIVEARRVE